MTAGSAFTACPGRSATPDTEDEYAELLHRHRTVLENLLGGDAAETRDLLVITVSWSGSSQPAPRAADPPGVMPDAVHWTSILTDDRWPGEETWTHRWASETSLHAPELTQLLRLVADDRAAGVIIATGSTSWLYHPYDGGADVIAATAQRRDQLRRAHADCSPPTRQACNTNNQDVNLKLSPTDCTAPSANQKR